jgi:predicted MFS family arabinose efflux permease
MASLIVLREKVMEKTAETRALRALALALFAMGCASLSVIGALQAMSVAMQLSPGKVAVLVTVFGAAFAVGTPVLQVVFGHVPRKRLLLRGLLLMSAGALGCALAPGYPLLVLARLATAAGAAAVSPVASSIGAALVAPARRGHALTVVFAGMTMASVAGVPLASWIAAAAGWRPMFGAVAVLGMGAAFAVSRLVPDAGAAARVTWGGLAALLRAPEVARALGVMLLAMTALFCTYTMITPILGSRFHAGPAAITLALGVYGMAGLLGNQAARAAARAWPAGRSVLTALAVLGLAFLALRLIPPLRPLVLLTMVGWAVAVDLFMPAQQRRMVELRPQLQGMVLALNSSVLFVGMAAGSAGGAWLARHAGLEAVPLASAALAGAAALLLACDLLRRPAAVGSAG